MRLAVASGARKNHGYGINGPPVEAFQYRILHRMLKLDRRNFLTTSGSLDRLVIHVIVARDGAVMSEKPKPSAHGFTAIRAPRCDILRPSCP